MNDKQIAAALSALAQQKPRIPAKSIEDMVRTVQMLNAARRQTEPPVEQIPHREKQTDPDKPESNRNKTL